MLTHLSLAYYKDASDLSSPLGVISLRACTSLGLASAKVSAPSAFEVGTADRVYFLVAEAEEEKWEWIRALERCVSECKEGCVIGWKWRERQGNRGKRRVDRDEWWTDRMW